MSLRHVERQSLFENLDIKSVVILASSYLFSFLRITLLHVTKSYFYWVITKT